MCESIRDNPNQRLSNVRNVTGGSAGPSPIIGAPKASGSISPPYCSMPFSAWSPGPTRTGKFMKSLRNPRVEGVPGQGVVSQDPMGKPDPDRPPARAHRLQARSQDRRLQPDRGRLPNPKEPGHRRPPAILRLQHHPGQRR